MRDRRGHGNQAYLSQTEDTDMTPSKAGYTPAVEEGGSIGATPTPISSTPEKTPEATPEPADTSASAGTPAPSAAAPAAEMMPDMAGEQQGGSPSYGSSPSPSQGEAAAAPIVEAPMPTASTGAPAASAPVASGGGAPANSYVGDDMGWDAASFAEAGGYDAVLTGAMPPGMCPGEGDGQDIFIFIDELNVDIINNTLIQETEINLIADDGSVIDIGGDFTAIQTQESLIQDGPIPGATGPADAAFIPQDTSFIEADGGMV